jgi:hypothetical protein
LVAVLPFKILLSEHLPLPCIKQQMLGGIDPSIVSAMNRY